MATSLPSKASMMCEFMKSEPTSDAELEGMGKRGGLSTEDAPHGVSAHTSDQGAKSLMENHWMELPTSAMENPSEVAASCRHLAEE